MCLSPVTIKNPHLFNQSMFCEKGEMNVLPERFKSRKQYIQVPCGHCSDCRNTYYSSILQRALCEHMSSYMFFVTLTYDNDHVPYLYLPNGHIIYYADYSHIQLLFKRLRDNTKIGRDFRYLAVNEYGDSYNRPHWHLLLFLAKLDTDDVNTPILLEQILFDEIRKYYAVNHGTRKNPDYRSLFTYHIKYTKYGIKTNYFVKYVDTNPTRVDNTTLTVTATKTIQYLISYMNKPSRFEKQIDKYISEFDYDPILQKKLKHILRSSVHFSKHFGDGFISGRRNIVRPISVRCSPAVSYYSQIKSSYPGSLDLFYQTHNDEYKSLKHFLHTYPFQLYSCIDDLFNSFDTLSFHYFCLAMLYYPASITSIVQQYYRFNLTPTISYEFKFLEPIIDYKFTTVNTSKNFNDDIGIRIRSYITDGLNQKVPFLPFLIPGDTPRYVPLCKYLRERYTLQKDVQNLYDMLGCSTYDDYTELLQHSLTTSLRREDISKSNEYKHALSDKTICITQKVDLSLSQQTEKTLYDILFKTF